MGGKEGVGVGEWIEKERKKARREGGKEGGREGMERGRRLETVSGCSSFQMVSTFSADQSAGR